MKLNALFRRQLDFHFLSQCACALGSYPAPATLSDQRSRVYVLCQFDVTSFNQTPTLLRFHIRDDNTKRGLIQFLVARRLPRDTDNILDYWKNFTSGLSYKVSIYRQHLPIVKYIAIAPYNSKSSLLA